MSSQVPSRAAAPGYRWYVLFVLTAAQACHYIDRSVVSVAVEPIRKAFALTDTQVGLVGGLGFALAFAVAALPIGYLVDRVNRRTLLGCVLVIWSGMTAIGGFANNFHQLLLARMGIGAAEAGGSPTAMSLLSDFFGPKERSTALGVWYLSGGIGTAITFVIGGYVAQHFGWRQVFFLAGIPGMIVALLVFFTVREPRRGQMELPAGEAEPDAQEKAASLGEVLAYVIRRPAILNTMAGIVLTAAMTSAFSIWVMSFFVRVHGMQMAVVGVWIAVGLAGFGTIVPLLTGILADRIASRGGVPRPERLALVSALVATGVIFAGVGTALAPGTGLALGFMCAWAALMLAHNGPANALVISLLRPRMRGVSIAALQIVAQVMGFGFGPLVVGLLSDFYGGGDSLRWAIVTGMAINVWAVLHFLLAARTARRDLARVG